jgi:NAD(P)-dependent dehydrogenase (short-subunit alcohol dehydrogenase family)
MKDFFTIENLKKTKKKFFNAGWFPRKGLLERKDYVNKIKKNISINRISNLQNLITAAEYPASSETAYFTGQNVVVDGGYSIY